MSKMTSWHVGVAAEAFVAAQFARLTYDVSVQYGANQPEYDLIAVEKNGVLINMDSQAPNHLFAEWAASGGFLTVNRGTVQLVCVTFEFAENIDVERAMRAKEKAESTIASAKDDKDLAVYAYCNLHGLWVTKL